MHLTLVLATHLQPARTEEVNKTDSVRLYKNGYIKFDIYADEAKIGRENGNTGYKGTEVHVNGTMLQEWWVNASAKIVLKQDSLCSWTCVKLRSQTCVKISFLVNILHV